MPVQLGPKAVLSTTNISDKAVPLTNPIVMSAMLFIIICLSGPQGLILIPEHYQFGNLLQIWWNLFKLSSLHQLNESGQAILSIQASTDLALAELKNIYFRALLMFAPRRLTSGSHESFWCSRNLIDLPWAVLKIWPRVALKISARATLKI